MDFKRSRMGQAKSKSNESVRNEISKKMEEKKDMNSL